MATSQEEAEGPTPRQTNMIDALEEVSNNPRFNESTGNVICDVGPDHDFHAVYLIAEDHGSVPEIYHSTDMSLKIRIR